MQTVNSLILALMALVSTIKASIIGTDLKKLKYMSPSDYKKRYGIDVAGIIYPNKISNNNKFLLGAEKESYLEVQGITDQYPIFMERLYLSGTWSPSKEKMSIKQFGVFEKKSGQFNSIFIQDIHSDNFFIFQLVDGEYLDRYTVEAAVNLSSTASTFDIKNCNFTYKRKLNFFYSITNY